MTGIVGGETVAVLVHVAKMLSRFRPEVDRDFVRSFVEVVDADDGARARVPVGEGQDVGVASRDDPPAAGADLGAAFPRTDHLGQPAKE